MLIRVLDVETTGMEPADAVVQIGWCDVRVSNGIGNVGEACSMFVNPGRPIPPEACAIHHIRDKDVEGAPTADIVFPQVMAGAPDLLAAHNSKFDSMFFGGGNIPWICSLKVARRVWPDAPRHGNQVLRYHLGLDEMNGFEPWQAMPPHRAHADAYVTAWLLCEALKHATVEQMIEWTGQPSLLPGTIKFGKHKGVLWSKVDPSYLDWIATKATEMDADTVYTAKHWLARHRADAR